MVSLKLSQKPNKPLSAHLAIIAGVSGLIYGLVFTLRFPLTSFYITIPPVDYTKLTHYSIGGLVAYVVGLGALFWLYLQAIRLSMPTNPQSSQHKTLPFKDKNGVEASAGDTKSGPVEVSTLEDSNSGQQSTVGGRFIVLSSAFLAAVSIFSYPLTAIDLFIYAIRTRGWALHGLNPLATAPEQLPTTDPWLKLAGEWIDAPSPYGPLWEWLSLGAFYLSGDDFLPHLLAIKILAAAAYLGCVWLVYKSLQQLRPEWASAGTIAFAWNPLVLLESVQNGHNDIVMTFFLLAAVWILVKWSANHQPQTELKFTPLLWLACFCLALSILVKFVTAIIAPFFLIAMALSQSKWGHRLAAILGYGFIIAGLVVLCMIPFWPGWDNWAVLKAGSQAGRSLLALLVLGFRNFLGTNTAFDLSRALILVPFTLIYLYYLGQTLSNFRFSIFDLRHLKSTLNSRQSPASLPVPVRVLPLSSIFFTLFWYVLLVAPVFHAWYLLWFLPLASFLLPNRRPLTVSIVFSVTALLIIPYFETIRVWYPLLLQNQLIGHLFGVPLLIGPPVVALFWPISPDESSGV